MNSASQLSVTLAWKRLWYLLYLALFCKSLFARHPDFSNWLVACSCFGWLPSPRGIRGGDECPVDSTTSDCSPCASEDLELPEVVCERGLHEPTRLSCWDLHGGRQLARGQKSWFSDQSGVIRVILRWTRSAASRSAALSNHGRWKTKSLSQDSSDQERVLDDTSSCKFKDAFVPLVPKSIGALASFFG